MTDDRELLLSWQGGSEGAFAAFYDRHSRPLYAYCVSLVGERGAAEELVQETFLAVVRRAASLELRPEMRPFLFTVARNAAHDRARRERRGRAALQRRREDAVVRAAAAERMNGHAVDAERLNRLLHELPAEQREAIVLKELGDMTYAEVAALTEAPENTVVSRCRYAARKLRQMLLARGRSESDV